MKILIITVSILMLVCASFFFVKSKVSSSVLRAEMIELDRLYLLWERKGRPMDSVLTNLLADYPLYKVAHQRFTIEGEVYVAIFKKENPAPRHMGAIYVTTNQLFILQPENRVITNIADVK